MPEYQLNDKDKAISVATDDKNWHVMSVPNFWNPIRIWLHGGDNAFAHRTSTQRCLGYLLSAGNRAL